MSVCVCVCVCVHVCTCVHVCACVCMCVCMNQVRRCMSTCVLSVCTHYTSGWCIHSKCVLA